MSREHLVPQVRDTQDFRALCARHEDLKRGVSTSMLAWRGSVAHGTHVPSTDPDSFDDLDLIGIVIPDPSCIIGLSQWGSRGTKEIKDDPYDIVLYDWRKFLRLLEKGNPNVLATLYMAQEFYLWQDTAAEALIEEGQSLFATKRCFPAFRGYAQSQGKKMFSGSYQGYMGEKRKELFDRYGYDVKQAAHYIRILRQGIEFLDTGWMEVYREDAHELMEIKRGEWPLERVRREAAKLEAELEVAGETSRLPAEPDRDLVNNLAIEVWELQTGGHL